MVVVWDKLISWERIICEIIFELTLFTCTEADEAYVIGKRGQYTPVGAYLAGEEIIKIAVEHGAQMIHPGESSATNWLGGAPNLQTIQVMVSCQRTPSSHEALRRPVSL
jgi:hypothetical protein